MFGRLWPTRQLAAKDLPALAAAVAADDACPCAVSCSVDNGSGHLACRLAAAIGGLRSDVELGGRQDALEEMHRVVLTLEGHLGRKTYRQHMDAVDDKYQSWRPEMLRLGKQLRFDPERHEKTRTADWTRAREVMRGKLPSGGDRSIKQVLKRHEKLAEALRPPPLNGHSARTIHSVKGAEFPAVCVVLSTTRAKGTIEHLETGAPASMAEELRKLYVGASRAQRLLAIATPHTQVKKLERLLSDPANSRGLKVINL